MNKDKIIIRKAKKSDIDDLIKLADQLRKTEANIDHNLKKDSYLSDEYREKQLKYIASRKKIYLVLELNGKIAGYVNGYLYEKTEVYCKEQVAYLDCLCVDKLSRQQGLGKRLIDEFAKIAKRKGAKYIKLNAFESNTPAVNLYKKEGFEEYSICYFKKI